MASTQARHRVQAVARLTEALRRAGYKSRLDVVATWLCGAVLPCAAALLALWGPWGDTAAILRTVLLTGLFVFALRTELTHSSGSTVATQPILLALALCSPVHWLPLAAAIGVYVGTSTAGHPRTVRIRMLRLGLGTNSWGLAAVVAATGVTWSRWTWPALAAAYGAQVLVDMIVGGSRAFIQRQPMKSVMRAMTQSYSIDALLGTIGLALVTLAHGTFPGLFLLAVPILLIWLLARDRQAEYAEKKELSSAYTVVTEQARVDPLTGLSNRRAWEEAVAAATAPDGGPVGGRTVTVLLADLDFLKVANDTYGHDEGDLLLIELARVLREAGPDGSTVARIGGDEFGILHVGEIDELAPDLVGLTRHLVEDSAQRSTATRVRLSASLGQASTPPCLTVESAISRADQASRTDKYERRAQRQDAPLPVALTAGGPDAVPAGPGGLADHR